MTRPSVMAAGTVADLVEPLTQSVIPATLERSLGRGTVTLCPWDGVDQKYLSWGGRLGCSESPVSTPYRSLVSYRILLHCTIFLLYSSFVPSSLHWCSTNPINVITDGFHAQTCSVLRGERKGLAILASFRGKSLKKMRPSSIPSERGASPFSPRSP